MYIKKYWGNYIGGSDDSLNLVEFLADQNKEEITLSEIFAKIGLNKQNWDFHQTAGYLEFTHSNGVEMDFHFAIDVITDLAAILLECSVNGSVNLKDLDDYNTPSRRIRITATVEEHHAMNKALTDFAKDPLSYDLHEMMSDDEIKVHVGHRRQFHTLLERRAGRIEDGFHLGRKVIIAMCASAISPRIFTEYDVGTDIRCDYQFGHARILSIDKLLRDFVFAPNGDVRYLLQNFIRFVGITSFRIKERRHAFEHVAETIAR